jgi:acetamidase/formamidase
VWAEIVHGARPGAALAVELLEFPPEGWGWTAIIPGFGLLAEEYPDGCR